MRKKNYKGRCEKRSLEKFTTICRTYDAVQYAYADILVKNKDVTEVRCNYTQQKNSLTTAYTMMPQAKYCDGEGQLLENYPTFHQFRYFYRKNRKMQTYFISRDGIKDYQKNSRPMLGDGVQSFAPNVGVGMLDATICDIYLKDACLTMNQFEKIIVHCILYYNTHRIQESLHI